MRHKLIILVGETASGKDTLAKSLRRELFFWRRTTTRPKRIGETDHNYKFVDTYEITEDTLLYSVFNDWIFALDSSEKPSASCVVIVSPLEVPTLKRYYPNALVVYLDVPAEKRYERLLERGDDINEINRRMSADHEDFKFLRGYGLKRNTIEHNYLRVTSSKDARKYIRKYLNSDYTVRKRKR